QVCGCRKLAEKEICGDGIDNDCNGRVDDCKMCNGVAVPDDDPKNCGACGHACRADQSCTKAACVCPAGSPNDCGGACTDTKTDGVNCGACGTACGPNRVCKDGACACPDASKGTYCDAAGCIDSATDANNCGGCGKTCGTAQACSGGTCGCTSFGFTVCGDTCTNLTSDAAHCGACDKACIPGERCGNSTCVCDSHLDCDGKCVSTTDVANCGA